MRFALWYGRWLVLVASLTILALLWVTKLDGDWLIVVVVGTLVSYAALDRAKNRLDARDRQAELWAPPTEH